MSYVATPLRLEVHREALARLWAENMSDERIAAVVPARMRWLYEQGPDGAPTTMLCKVAETGEIVGCGSFLPRPIWVDGRRIRAGVLCDFAVTGAHRIMGAALTVQRGLVEAARSGGLELLCGYPNDRSLPVFQRIGYRVVGQATNWAKPIHSAYKLRESPRLGWAAPILAGPLDLGLALLDRARGLGIRRAARSELFSGSDVRIDGLWARARAGYGIIGEKTSAYLEWRYARFPTAEHRFFGLFTSGGERLTGYAVFKVEEGKAFVRDLFVDREEASEVALLLALADHLRPQGVASLALTHLGGPEFGGQLRFAGFFLRPGSRALVVHPEALSEAVRARVLDPASWFTLDGEIDI